jgi:hypothetical protein
MAYVSLKRSHPRQSRYSGLPEARNRYLGPKTACHGQRVARQDKEIHIRMGHG